MAAPPGGLTAEHLARQTYPRATRARLFRFTALASCTGARLAFEKREGPMRYGTFITLTAGLVALTPAAQAETRAAYVTMVLQAFAAKVECPGTDVVYQDLVKKAQDMEQPDGTTESVRKAIAWMLTGGKMGEKGDDPLMGEVALAMQTTDLDQSGNGNDRKRNQLRRLRLSSQRGINALW